MSRASPCGGTGLGVVGGGAVTVALFASNCTVVVWVAVSIATAATTLSWLTGAPPLAGWTLTSMQSPTLMVLTRPVRRTLAVALAAMAAAGRVVRRPMVFHSARPEMVATVSKVAGCAPGSGMVCTFMPVGRGTELGDPVGGVADEPRATGVPVNGLITGGTGGGASIVKAMEAAAANPGLSL